MELIGCNCSWDIPGVSRLPTHHHYQRFERTIGRVVNDNINIWVPWKEIARALISGNDRGVQENGE